MYTHAMSALTLISPCTNNQGTRQWREGDEWVARSARDVYVTFKLLPIDNNSRSVWVMSIVFQDGSLKILLSLFLSRFEDHSSFLVWSLVDRLTEYNNGMYIIHSRSANSAHYCYCYILQSTVPLVILVQSLHSPPTLIAIRARHDRRPPGFNREVPALDDEARVPNERRVLESLILLVPHLERQIRRCNHNSQ